MGNLCCGPEGERYKRSAWGNEVRDITVGKSV